MAVAVDSLSRPELDHAVAVVLLFEWRPAELRKAQGQFRRLGVHDLEQIYDETVEVLLSRPHDHEQHLQRALRIGIRLRALMLLRDRAIHRRVVDEAAPVMQADGEDRAWSVHPEKAVLAREDDFIIGEFIAELTLDERRAFALLAEGKSWRAIATALGMPENEARNVTRSVERKRERFVTLFESGRLCGCRSRTIDEVLAGEQTGELAWRQALAHVRHCRECRAEHQVTFAQLRARFDREALALLPLPVAGSAHISLVDRVLAVLERPVRLLERLSGGGGVARERVVEAAAATGVTAKVAVSVAGVVAVVATGVTVGVHEASPGHRHHHVTSAPTVAPLPRSSALVSQLGVSPLQPSAWNAAKSGSDFRATPGHLVQNNGAPGALVNESRSPGHLVSGGSSARNSSGDRAPGTLVAGPSHSGGGARDEVARSASYEPSPAGSGPAAPGRLAPSPTSGHTQPGSLVGG
jgi:DNA-directed RNA polymerase specialized sigma24 family protein